MPSQQTTQPAPDATIFDESLHPRLRMHRQFASRFLPDARDLTVYLPEDYDQEPDRRYPVMLMHDGQNLFDPRTSYIPGSTWQVAEAADKTIAAGTVEPLIIVGIANTAERRLAEYTPDADTQMGGGEAARYGQLLVQELLPFLSARYRIRSGAENTGLGGSSLGGLVTLYLGLRYPHIFGRLAVMSPSVWWNHRSILDYVGDAAHGLLSRPRLWLDVGEGEGRQTVLDTEALRTRLLASGWKPGEDFLYMQDPEGTHDESSWAKRVPSMLSFLFPGR